MSCRKDFQPYVQLISLHEVVRGTICEVSTEMMQRLSSRGHSSALDTLVPPVASGRVAINTLAGQGEVHREQRRIK